MGTVKLHTLNHQPAGLWQLQGDLTDSSGNGFTLAAEAGTVRYTSLCPGLLGVRFDGTLKLYRSTYAAALNLLGDMTFECLIAVDVQPTGAYNILTHAASGETSPTNYAYNIGMTPSPSSFGWFSESGAGSNASYTFVKVTFPPGLCHLVFTRVSNVVTVYINGVSQGSSTTLVAPTDSTGGLFRIGDPGGVPPNCVMASIKMIPRGLSAAEVKAEYGQTVGLKYGNFALRSSRNVSFEDYLATPDVTIASSALKYHTTAFSPVGLWNLNGALTDSSGNGFTLTVESGGTERYASMGPGTGLKGFWFDGATRLVYNTTGTALQRTGDMTIEMVITVGAYSANAVLISYGGNAGTAVTNLLYNLAMSTTDGMGLTWSSESGTASLSSFTSTLASLPLGQICHLAVTRNTNVIQYYLNGVAIGSQSSSLTGPTSGTSSVFHIGGEAGTGTNFVPKFTTISSVKVIASALTGAQILTEYQATLGQFYG